jgi:hypothetical protein
MLHNGATKEKDFDFAYPPGRYPCRLTTADSIISDKAELVGSTTKGPYTKPELDGSTTRAELKAPAEEAGAGICVHKPELLGTHPPVGATQYSRDLCEEESRIRGPDRAGTYKTED